ncbi:MAG TPA: RDD family protein [Bacteroidetes bacterium]|nr:RDD family protein [Bacteroidota bacterium]
MQTIDIRTTQHVTIEYELASLRERFLALLVDVLIVMVFCMVVFYLLFSTIGDVLSESSMAANALFSFFPIAAFIFYQLLSEVIADGQSLGKKAMRIKAVRLDGKEPGFSDFLLRAVFHLVDTIFSAGIVGAMLISSSEKSQRLGDMASNTTVIRIKFDSQFRLEDILKINSLADYQPQYPQVRQLSEEDMLLIKNIISRHRKFKNKAHQEVVRDLVENLTKQLDITERPKDKIAFLKTLIRDYIVLTR